MEFYLSQIIQGFVMGSIYGLVGLAMTFVYRSTGVLNFSQGEMACSTTYVCWVLLALMPAWVAIPCALAYAFILGCVVEMLLKFIRKRTPLNTMIATIGVFSIISSIDLWKFGSDPLTFPSPIPEGTFSFREFSISYQSLWIFAVTAFVSVCFYLLFKTTQVGIAFQANSEDPVATRLKGVRIGFLNTLAWGLASVIGGVAGMLLAPSHFLHPGMMAPILLYSFAAAVVGGLRTSFGALAGGILIGITENLAGTLQFVGSELKIVAVYVALISFLMVRRRGLFGRDEPRKI